MFILLLEANIFQNLQETVGFSVHFMRISATIWFFWEFPYVQINPHFVFT
jgi:hypothetical protein